MSAVQLSAHFDVAIDGRPLPLEASLVAISVEDHLHLPDCFAATFSDGGRGVLGALGARIGATVTITADVGGSPTELLAGEITGLDAELTEGLGTVTVVRGSDQSHRLFRGRITESYRNMAYSDIARKVAERHGLEAGEITATMPIHEHVAQVNQHDWSFLHALAREVGHELAVRDGKLHFRKPAAAATAPPPGTFSTEDPLALVRGENLLSLRASISAAEQVPNVEVRGWNPATKQAVVARVPSTTTLTANGSEPAALAGTFASPDLVGNDVPLSDVAAAQALATAMAEEVAGASTELEGTARGNPALRAGTPISIGELGDPFDGRYVLTSARHSWDAYDGYTTTFTATGRHERSLLGLVGAAGDDRRISGVVPALIDDVDDPEREGRVRLRFPWLAEQYVSGWCRTVQPGAGAKRGLFLLPEVGDEVLVAFEQGDPRFPIVLGGMHNALDPPATGPEPLVDRSSHAVNNRLWTSRTGHQILMVDGTRETGITIVTADGRLRLHLDQDENRLEIVSNGDLTIRASGTLTIDAGRLAISSQGQADLSARQIALDAQSTVSVHGSQIRLN